MAFVLVQHGRKEGRIQSYVEYRGFFVCGCTSNLAINIEVRFKRYGMFRSANLVANNE